ncbi:hypothetical protein [Thiohalorhabdus denitrificans]|uniref:Uncharacterized protein n=1 Tax=Thiohalorhabdus denitrificans TaxID=381306 RepID=A0A1G5D1Z8_9GAMM|nr:hypothetical protein [Thiohalorhabdus denitrificans]SCY08557.1 hypothetical protein SAMN05661077_1138 [Thiohalorhabdus denitrificans]
MESSWAERQRRTNRLARKLAGHVLHRQDVTPSQLLGLSKLAWISDSYEGSNASYIRSTKIPALESILGANYSGLGLTDVAADVAEKLNDPSAEELVAHHTGFTNFYNAFRNSVGGWVKDNFPILLSLFRQASEARTDAERLEIVRQISTLERIPKANNKGQRMRSEYFLAPAFFILDPEIRFPIINGSNNVQELLNSLDASNSSLEDQYLSMVQLYGNGGIRDAADLDQLGGDDLPDFIPSSDGKTRKQILTATNTEEGSGLSLKDEADIESLQESKNLINKRIHNQITNQLQEKLSEFTLLEGCTNDAMFDVMVKNYDSKRNDLIIEVKSSSERSHVRMAIGQVYDYWFNTKGEIGEHIAILLPEKPSTEILSLLSWLGIGAMWLNEGHLNSLDEWLEHLKD